MVNKKTVRFQSSGRFFFNASAYVFDYGGVLTGNKMTLQGTSMMKFSGFGNPFQGLRK